jgi:acyl-CoA synthetase (AMP-forming)/AMP-acid ligase II
MSATNWTFADALSWSCVAHARRPAWIQDERSVTYSELWQQAEALASALERGAEPGGRVAILAENSSAYVACFAAAALQRVVLVPLNPRLSAEELAFILADSGCEALISDAAHLGRARSLAASADTVSVLRLNGSDGTLVADDDSRLDFERARGAVAPLESDPLALMYTAAVAGRPRGAVMTQRAFSYQMLNMAHALGLGVEDRVAVFTPLCHTAALTYSLAALQVGGACVSLAAFDGGAAAALVSRAGVTVLPAFAPMPLAILDAADTETIDLSSLRCIVARDDASTMRRFFAAVPGLQWQMGNFGQTETHGMAVAGTRMDSAAFEAAAGRAPGGRPMPMTRVGVVDAKGTEIAAGAPGELVVKGPNTAAGYWNLPAESEHALRGGWWHTGDVGRIDEDGSIHFVGRLSEKELIKTGGENVYPQEVESVLARHPSVAEAVVIGVPDPVWTEAVKAVIVFQDGAVATAEELSGFCRESIASYKKPRYYAFVSALPRGADGKVSRAEVVRQFGVGHKAPVDVEKADGDHAKSAR